MTLNLSNYVKGMVRIRIRGAMPEKFVNLCIAQHILLWRIIKCQDDLYANIRLSDFFQIRRIIRVSNVRISVVSYWGLPFIIKRIKRRKMMLIGAVIALVVINVMASFIWFVDVTGNKYISADKVKEIAEQQGLKPGIGKDNINAKQIEKSILLNIPEIAWAGINFTGTRAEIEIVEKTIPKQQDKAPADIVAAKDGVITEFITLAGKPMVKKGDTVKKGDMLITGVVHEQTLYNEAGQPIVNNNPPKFVRANGIVKARVWYETYGEAALVMPVHERTGKKEVAVNIKIGNNQISLKGAKLDPNTEFESEVIYKKLPIWRNSDFTVESEIDIYHEVNTLWLQKTFEEARDEARAKALAVVQALVPETAHVISRTSEVLETSETNLVRIKVNVETIEEIGKVVPITN